MEKRIKSIYITRYERLTEVDTEFLCAEMGEWHKDKNWASSYTNLKYAERDFEIIQDEPTLKMSIVYEAKEY